MEAYTSILKFLGDITLILLFVRYLTYGYGSYAAGGVFPFLYRATEMLCAPLRPLIPVRIRVQSDYTPLLAMALVVVGRGVLYSVGDLLWQGVSPALTLPFNIRLSVVEFLNGALLVGAIFLFIGAALLRGGGYYSSLLFRVFTDTGAAVFRGVYKVVRVSNEWALFVGALAVLSLVYAVLWGLVTWTPFIPYIWLGAFLHAAYVTVFFFSIVLLLTIILSWFRPDPSNPLVQLLSALTYPSLNWARRTFPWARLDIFDLSPILIFLLLMVVQSILVSIGRQIPHTASMESFRRPHRIRIIEETDETGRGSDLPSEDWFIPRPQ
jgi:YggT family protein